MSGLPVDPTIQPLSTALQTHSAVLIPVFRAGWGWPTWTWLTAARGVQQDSSWPQLLNEGASGQRHLDAPHSLLIPITSLTVTFVGGWLGTAIVHWMHFEPIPTIVVLHLMVNIWMEWVSLVVVHLGNTFGHLLLLVVVDSPAHAQIMQVLYLHSLTMSISVRLVAPQSQCGMGEIVHQAAHVAASTNLRGSARNSLRPLLMTLKSECVQIRAQVMKTFKLKSLSCSFSDYKTFRTDQVTVV